MAEDHRSPGAEIVDVAIAVGVEEPRTLGALHERRSAAHGSKCADRGVDAAGEEALGALLEGLGTGMNGCGDFGTHRVSIEFGAPGASGVGEL